jgi:hypothetical protein
MIALLPVESDSIAVVIVSVVLMLWFFIKVLPALRWAVVVLMQKSPPEYSVWLLAGFIACSK